MHHADYDSVIVGGGIAGLMTAVRLAQQGQKVALFEKGLLGNKASTSNHGMVHSGALYADLHPEIVKPCREAVQLFKETFPDAVVSTEESWFFGRTEKIERLLRIWKPLGCPCRLIKRAEVDSMIRTENLEGFSYVASDDISVFSRQVLVGLVLLGLRHGVDFQLHAPVTEVIVAGHKAVGVRVASRGEVAAKSVVIAAGLGIHVFAENLSLRIQKRLRSRIDMMVGYREGRIRRSILCLDLGGATIAPAPEQTVLASLYGGTQPWVWTERRWAVSVRWAAELAEKMEKCFRPGLMDIDSGVAFMCSKTELSTEHDDRWGVSPGFAVIDHQEEDGLENLWTLIPGKMTLAFHASKALVDRMLDAPVELPLATKRSDRVAYAESLVGKSPWQHLESEELPAERRVS